MNQLGNAAQLYPAARLAGSKRKIREPFVLDPTMCFYSPQANCDALSHPRVRDWLDMIQHRWTPSPVLGERPRVALLLPCTKYKPYLTSREHRAINQALLDDGWGPVGESSTPASLQRVLSDIESPELLHSGPLLRDGVVLDRFVISEPLALVPYELAMYLNDSQSPATSYDDPGLFEARGTSVSPERDDFTATPRADGGWSWGPLEREAYVQVHNAMSAAIAATLRRIGHYYRGILAWCSPGLTHRSFLADARFRDVDGLRSAREGVAGSLPLIGVLDLLPGSVTILPTKAQVETAKGQLGRRLTLEGRRATPASVSAVFARRDGHDTPLGLPELTAQLAAELDRRVREL